MKRRELYQRMTLLEKITQGTERAKSLMEERALLQEQRRTANIEASFQRQRLQVRQYCKFVDSLDSKYKSKQT